MQCWQCRSENSFFSLVIRVMGALNNLDTYHQDQNETPKLLAWQSRKREISTKMLILFSFFDFFCLWKPIYECLNDIFSRHTSQPHVQLTDWGHNYKRIFVTMAPLKEGARKTFVTLLIRTPQVRTIVIG